LILFRRGDEERKGERKKDPTSLPRIGWLAIRRTPKLGRKEKKRGIFDCRNKRGGVTKGETKKGEEELISQHA